MKIAKLIFLQLVSFFYMFGPIFNNIGSWADSIFITSVLLSFYVVIFHRQGIPVYMKYFASLIPVFVYTLIIISEYGETGFSDYLRFFLKPIRILITIYGGFGLIYLVHKINPKTYANTILVFIFLSIFMHASIMCYQLYSPEFKVWIYSFTTTGDFRGSYGYDFRMGGLSGSSGGAVLSVVQSVGIIIVPFFISNLKFLGKIAVVVGSLVILASVLFCGRSGLFLTIVFLPLSVILASNSIAILFWLRTGMAFGVIILLFFVAFLVYDQVEAKSPLYYSLTRSMDTFINFRKSGDFEDKTTETLVGHILLPTTPKIWLFGEGEVSVNTQFDRTLSSDIGYIRDLWGLGLPMSILYWFPILFVAGKSFLARKKNEFAGIVFVISLIMLLFHAKENFMYVRMLLSILSLSLFVLSFSSNKIHPKTNAIETQK